MSSTVHFLEFPGQDVCHRQNLSEQRTSCMRLGVGKPLPLINEGFGGGLLPGKVLDDVLDRARQGRWANTDEGKPV